MQKRRRRGRPNDCLLPKGGNENCTPLEARTWSCVLRREPAETTYPPMFHGVRKAEVRSEVRSETDVAMETSQQTSQGKSFRSDAM